jgi:hypothetical protein
MAAGRILSLVDRAGLAGDNPAGPPRRGGPRCCLARSAQIGVGGRGHAQHDADADTARPATWAVDSVHQQHRMASRTIQTRDSRDDSRFANASLVIPGTHTGSYATDRSRVPPVCLRRWPGLCLVVARWQQEFSSVGGAVLGLRGRLVSCGSAGAGTPYHAVVRRWMFDQRGSAGQMQQIACRDAIQVQ